MLVGHRAHQDRAHVAASGQLIEPLHRQQRPLPAAFAGLNDLDGHVLVAVGQLPELLGQHIQGDGSLVLGCSCTISLANCSSVACRPDRSDTRTCLTATTSPPRSESAKHSEVPPATWPQPPLWGRHHRRGSRMLRSADPVMSARSGRHPAELLLEGDPGRGGCACRPTAKCHPGADDTAGRTAYRRGVPTGAHRAGAE